MLQRPRACLQANPDAPAPQTKAAEATDIIGRAPHQGLQRLVEPLQKRARGLIHDQAAVEKIVDRAARRVDRHRELSAALAPLRRLTV
jgi:predicted ATP-dependent protease